MDLSHIPFTNYEIIGNLFGYPILLVYYILAILGLLYMITGHYYSKAVYGQYLYTKHGYILIGGKFNDGKTRLLAQFAFDIHKILDTFVISNYYNAYSFISWSSFADFVAILDDLLLL